MMIASTTHFKLKGWKSYPFFMVLTIGIFLQCLRFKGLKHIQIRFFELRTLTFWKSFTDVKRFRDLGLHGYAKDRVKGFGSIEVATWETDILPTWNQAIEKLENL